MDKQVFIRSAITAALALGVASAALAAPTPTPVDPSKDKCFGVAKAGANDCASVTGSHACTGTATKSNDPGDFKYVEKGTCTKMGGTLMAPAK